MTPNEIFAIPSVQIQPWYERYDVVSRVLEFADWDPYVGYPDLGDAERFTVEKKVGLEIDYRRSVGLSVLYFDGKPFAITFMAGREGRDEQDMFVTDPETWKAARIYAVATVGDLLSPEKIVGDLDAELASGYYGYAIARFGDATRFVPLSDVSPFTGTPVFDRAKFKQDFDAHIRPLAEKIGAQGGLADPLIFAAASKAVGESLLGQKKAFKVDLGDRAVVIGGTVVDGQAYLVIVDTGCGDFGWSKKIVPCMVGPASILECFTDFAHGRLPEPTCEYVRDAAATFDCDPMIVHAELLDFLAGGGKGMEQRLLEALPKDMRVDEALWGDYADFAIGFATLDNPDIRRFCLKGGISDADAQKRIDLAAKIVSRRNEAAKTPTL
jgi:hypothetical protein